MRLLLTPSEFFTYITLTNLLAVLGSVLLWATCFFFAIIARRYELVLRKKTNWQFLMFAPSGILLYVLIQALAFASQIKMSPLQSWLAYTFFLISGLLSLWGAEQFRRAIRVDRRKKGGETGDRVAAR
jgi:membrane protein implicated in regulation of membrane protease activity